MSREAGPSAAHSHGTGRPHHRETATLRLDDVRSSGDGVRVTKRLPAAQKVARDVEIALDRARGLTWAKIAERHGISERQAREIVRGHRQGVLAEGVDPVAECADVLAQIDQIIEELALVAVEAAQDSVRLGAVNGRLKAIQARAGIAQAVGLLPLDLGLVRVEFENQQLIADMLDLFGRYGAPPEAVDELKTIWQRPRVFAVASEGPPRKADTQAPARGGLGSSGNRSR